MHSRQSGMIGSVKGKTVHFDDRYLHVELDDGRVISTPMATMQQLKNFTFICRGTGIEWPDIDYHLSVESMLASRSERQVA